MSPPRPIGIAILGSGAIAAEHIDAFEGDSRSRVRVVLARDPARGRELVRRTRDAETTSDLAEALSADVDAVVVCGRTETHLERATAALAAGKHVLIEKPPTFDPAAFDSLARTSAQADRRLMVAQTARFQPAVAGIGAAVGRGDIGRVRLVHASWDVGHVWPGAWRSWQLDPATSGGHVAHNGMHPLDTAIWLTGRRPVRVFARGWATHASHMPTPDSFHLVVRFDDDSQALLQTSYGLRPRGTVARRLLAVGEEGTLLHDSEHDPVHRGSTTAPPSVAGAIGEQAAHFLDVVEGGEQLVTVEQSRWALAAALAGQRSLDEGRAVEVVARTLETTTNGGRR